MARRSLIAIGLVALSSCRGPATGEPNAGSTAPGVLDANGVVVRVVDGDTAVIRFGSVSEIVRFVGINTPETVKPHAAVECYGPEASARTKELLPKGASVRVERDAEARDVYSRLLGYVYRASDGLFVNLSLVTDGFATPLTIAPNTAHETEFVAAARAAEAAGRGLWNACRG